MLFMLIVPGDEQQKLTQEYQDYQKKLDQQKADYRKDHPEDKEPDVDDWFETDSQRELRQIFQGQNQIFQVIRELSTKLDEVVGRQERTMSLISQTTGALGAGVAPGQVPPPVHVGVGGGDSIRRHEVDAVLNNQNLILNTAKELR